MAIKHAVVKAPGQRVFAVADWNANHTIDPNTITAAQTQFADQDVKIASSPTFSALTITNNIVVGGNVDGVDVSAFKTAYDAHDHSAADPTQVDHADLTNVLPDQHHAKQHALSSAADHTGTITLTQHGDLSGDVLTKHKWTQISNKPATFPPSAHGLVSASHTAAGLTIGHVVRATGAAAFAWQQLQHSDLGGVTSDLHHAQLHNAASHTDIASTGAQIDDAVGKRHTQNTDTALGAQSQNLDMNTHKIVGLVDPAANQEAATKKYVDDKVVGGLWEVDGAETQLIVADEIDMQTKKIINVVDPTLNQDAATKKYVDDTAGGLWEVDGAETQLIVADEIDMQTKKIINVVDPAANQDAATKKYVDDNIAVPAGTYYWSCAGVNFRPRYPDVDNVAYTSTGGHAQPEVNGKFFYADVTLPHGAVVTAVIVYGDVSAGAETYDLRRVNLSTGGSDAMAAENINTEDNTIANATIDNSSHGYFFRTSSMDVGDFIYGARITYTL